MISGFCSAMLLALVVLLYLFLDDGGDGPTITP